ncbi:Fe-S protein assembly chaperone HscA [Halieaceae bacterium IMCC14734]|uniref:Chaperone protein HscA homolog n=1 Tax=Candidatus Litorirhabdus singularis TaxID=2518993 RepID=A0ABT3TJZ9_9GAMM|nr:Fe-S protein assembly chaperone HscA [Candidatus Litorirhabdus singularis]MCX2981749.1 Fe-S protein assembly chaperone HscA [Candidatus Litorirhabdus singularis]
MALLQISEPGQAAAPHEGKHALGIDLGTTNSLVASVRSGSAETLPDAAGNMLLPSVVYYSAQGVPQVGNAALTLASEYPLDTLQSVKRFMGRSRNDVAGSEYQLGGGEEGQVRFLTSAGEITPVEASAAILNVLAERGRNTLGADIDGVVITVPAYFDDAQRQATKDAAQLAGLKVLRLLNEPTAAAVAYGLDSGDDGVVAVYDLGGGTFDVSILRLDRGVFEVLATGGDSALGGDDFDALIAAWAQQEYSLQEPEPAQARALLTAARAAKQALSDVEQVNFTVPGLPELTLTREVLEGLVQPLVKRTILASKRALRDAGVATTDIDSVVLVGGSTRVPLVRAAVSEFFGREPLADIDPDTVVAVGAALQADVLVGNKPDSDMLLLDVIPLSLGLETMGGLMERVIERNTTIPVAKAQEFTTYKDGQTAMSIHVLQGEREMVEGCRSLARFELRDIPPMAAGAARIRVTFQVDADGLLNVSAREETTGVETGITIKPSYGLEEDEIAEMLRASWEFAAEDMQSRQLAEQRLDARQLLENLQSALDQDGATLLETAEREALLAQMAALAAGQELDDIQTLKMATDSLARASESFAARRMDASIKQALTGLSVAQLDQLGEAD